MAKANQTTPKPLVLKRLFNAPRRRIWKAWTDPEQFKQWWGPENYTCSYSEIDLWEGGRYLHCMRDQEGKDYWSTGRYIEIVPMQKIVFTDSFSDEHGNVVPASYYGMGENLPLEMQITVSLQSKGIQTVMLLEHLGFLEREMKEMAAMGWNQSFDKLAKSIR